jgi:gas vesicle protein
MNTSKLIISTLLGAGAGLLVGLLIAPEKGVETRRKISEVGNKYASSLKDKVDVVLDTVVNKFSKARYDISDTARDISRKYKKGNSVEIN